MVWQILKPNAQITFTIVLSDFVRMIHYHPSELSYSKKSLLVRKYRKSCHIDSGVVGHRNIGVSKVLDLFAG